MNCHMSVNSLKDTSYSSQWSSKQRLTHQKVTPKIIGYQQPLVPEKELLLFGVLSDNMNFLEYTSIEDIVPVTSLKKAIQITSMQNSMIY